MELKRDRGAITHDDRLDALAMAVSYWSEQMARDAEKKIKDRKEFQKQIPPSLHSPQESGTVLQ